MFGCAGSNPWAGSSMHLDMDSGLDMPHGIAHQDGWLRVQFSRGRFLGGGILFFFVMFLKGVKYASGVPTLLDCALVPNSGALHFVHDESIVMTATCTASKTHVFQNMCMLLLLQ